VQRFQNQNSELEAHSAHQAAVLRVAMIGNTSLVNTQQTLDSTVRIWPEFGAPYLNVQ
jgi:hypothetical protein